MNLPIKYEETVDLSQVKYDKEGNVVVGGIVKEISAGLRPGHKSGLPQIFAERKNEKLISHNYCHSGEGWSLLFSTVDESIKNLLELISDKEKDELYEITIIGLGVIGFTTALRLLELGYKKIKLVGEDFENIVSYAAGGLIDTVYEYKRENLKRINQLFKDNYMEYKKIANGEKYTFLAGSIKEVEYYSNYLLRDSGCGYLINKGILPFQNVNLRLRQGNKIFNNMIVQNTKTFHVVPSLYLSKLYSYLKSNNCIFEKKNLSSFYEIDSKIIFNCTGLGSYSLNNDIEVRPICGHFITLNDESFSKLNYIILINNLKEVTNIDLPGIFYFMPKSSGYIGGTFIQDYKGDDKKFNQEMINGIMERARLIFNGYIPFSKIKPKF
jgi:hypothetical protein